MRGPRSDKSNSKMAVECNFINWMSNYAVFMGLVLSVYPECSWHLVRHMSNVLKPHTMASKTAAVEYDEAFGKAVSNCEVARLDLINNKVWLVKIGPHMRPKSNLTRPRLGIKHATPLRVCWEYSRGKCSYIKCRFDHNCDACPHPRLSCPQNVFPALLRILVLF